MPAPAIIVNTDIMRLDFDSYDIESYSLFLKAKRLPEYKVEFTPESERYSIIAPARFAPLLGVALPALPAGSLTMLSRLFDDQQHIVQLALAAKRFACWSDCGLGKTPIGLEFARHVAHRTGKRVLIMTLNEIVPQWLDETKKFYGDELQIERLRSREDMKAWCAAEVRPGDGLPRIGVTNYEKMNYVGLENQSVSEMKFLGGIILDESSRLKGGGGKQKWALIKSCKGIEYKLSLTATPAPNDTIEFASQASFLEKMRSDDEIIWTYFTKDPKSQEWKVKPHARGAFFEFMSSWSIYVRDPKKYGWRLNHPDVPKPIVKVHHLAVTPEQQSAVRQLDKKQAGGQMMMFGSAMGIVQRGKASQIAKGFVYAKSGSGRSATRIHSQKPGFIADLIQSEVRNFGQTLVWTVFDEESTILAEKLSGRGVNFALLTGKTSTADRLNILEQFRTGKIDCLISRASMLGYGMNFQFCKSMIFSGFNDSYEAYYQAVRRAFRYGQLSRLRVHVPCVMGLEDDVLENIFDKEAKHEASIDEMEKNYIAASSRLRGVA